MHPKPCFLRRSKPFGLSRNHDDIGNHRIRAHRIQYQRQGIARFQTKASAVNDHISVTAITISKRGGVNIGKAGFVAGAIGNGYGVADKAVLLIGAGGAARAIAVALVDARIGKLIIANRSLGKAEELANLLASKTGFTNVHAAALADCDGGDADMIINSTSLGLKPGDALPLALDAVRPDTVIADIIMVPAETEWLVAAQKAGLRVHYGRHMLDYQIDLIGKFIGAL